jgi:hypothetical protein
MMNAMEIYNKLARPPKEALKSIGGGRLKGMTDIKPQWRIKISTENFGLCGFGWKYTIDKTWSEPAINNEVMCFAIISLYLKIDGEWSEAIPGVGGSQIVELEKNYDFKDKQNTPNEPKKVPYANDEGYKMAVTDALSVAFKMVGVAADIYMGNWDGTKYKDDLPEAQDIDYFLQAIVGAKDKDELKTVYEKAYRSFGKNDLLDSMKNQRKAELGL